MMCIIVLLQYDVKFHIRRPMFSTSSPVHVVGIFFYSDIDYFNIVLYWHCDQIVVHFTGAINGLLSSRLNKCYKVYFQTY